MQTSLMFIDLKPLGITPNSQKLAIKMPEGADNLGVDGDAGFSDMINALMAVKPEELRNSLEEMEWVEVQGESSGYAPLLDLSAAQASGDKMTQMLFCEMAQDNTPQSKPLGLRFVDIGRLEDGSVGFIKTKIDHIAPQDLKNPLDLSKGTITQSVIDTTKEGMSQAAVSATTPEVSQTTVDSGPQAVAPDKSFFSAGEDFTEIKPFYNKLERVQQHAVRTQAQPTQMATQTNDEAVVKPIMHEDELIDKGANVSNRVNGLSDNHVSNIKEQITSPIAQQEVTNKSAKPSDPGVAPMAAIQNDDKANLISDQAADQQFGDRNDANAKHILRQASRERHPSEEVRQNFNAAQMELSSEASNEDTDTSTNIRQDNKILFQQVVSRLKGSPVQSVEHASGQQESIHKTGDTQSNVIRQIVQRMSLHQHGSQSTMTLKLKPAFLGNVHMQISTGNQQVVVRMATESTAVKEMVEQGLQHLKTEMQHHGLEIDKFEVFVANDNEESRPGQDLAGFRQALKQRQQNAMKKGPNGNIEEHNEIAEKKVEDRHVTDNTSEIDYFA